MALKYNKNSGCLVHPKTVISDESHYWNALIKKGCYLEHRTLNVTKPLIFPIMGNWKMAYCDIYIGDPLLTWAQGPEEPLSLQQWNKVQSKMWSVCIHIFGTDEVLWINKLNVTPNLMLVPAWVDGPGAVI